MRIRCVCVCVCVCQVTFDVAKYFLCLLLVFSDLFLSNVNPCSPIQCTTMHVTVWTCTFNILLFWHEQTTWHPKRHETRLKIHTVGHCVVGVITQGRRARTHIAPQHCASNDSSNAATSTGVKDVVADLRVADRRKTVTQT